MQCVNCESRKNLTNHHLFPRVHFGNKHNDIVIRLCKKCHSELEYLIQDGEGKRSDGSRACKTRQFYVDCFVEFITDPH